MAENYIKASIKINPRVLPKTNVIIYNINSFGGNYEYAKFIFHAYCNHSSVNACNLLMPSNAEIQGTAVQKILLPDIINSNNKWVKKFYYLYRSLINPFRLFRYLGKKDAAVVLFNDFDQHTAFLWAPLFYLFRRNHRYGVYLHDPDRDAFFRSVAMSRFTMRQIMSFMDIALYHGYLPKKEYYEGSFLKVSVPHGIYTDVNIDQGFADKILRTANGFSIVGVIGNIRSEKNYELIIDALCNLENVRLLIAGKPSNSTVSVEYYKDYATKKGVSDKIIWQIDYLDQARFNAAISCCDIILLCYKTSFTSQSGVLNSIAGFYKKLIVTNTQSALRQTAEKYELAEIIPNNDTPALVAAIEKLLKAPKNAKQKNWKLYIANTSWEKHVDIAVKSFNKIT